MNYKTMLAKVLGEKELMEMNVQTIKDDESLFYKLVDKNFLLIVDWSGEDRQGMLYNFFNNRLQSMLGVQLVVSEDEVYQKYNQEIEEPKRGDFIPFALSYFDKQLEKLGARVVLLDLENDTYNILVAYKKDAKKLKSIKSDFWKLSTLEQKQGRVVISITCPNCTDDNRDRYLVRGNKLYPIMKDGINELPLVKISKKQAKIELQDYPFYYNVKD